MKREHYICAVTSTKVQLIGPFDNRIEGASWGRKNIKNTNWNTVLLFENDADMTLVPIDPVKWMRTFGERKTE